MKIAKIVLLILFCIFISYRNYKGFFNPPIPVETLNKPIISANFKKNYSKSQDFCKEMNIKQDLFENCTNDTLCRNFPKNCDTLIEIIDYCENTTNKRNRKNCVQKFVK